MMDKLIYSVFILVLLIITTITTASAEVWCYSCISNQPGCGDHVDWRIHQAITCDTTCVKIIETKDSTSIITRDCLSNIKGIRTDIPADTFEGCRDAAENPKLAVDVVNTIKQYDLQRSYYTSTKYCFCKLDHWCNGSNRINSSSVVIITLVIVLITRFVISS
ncbi:hypothetical protein GQR58_018936 [Nymphon striatum]|nr:hypothetical protein GQR58_018936 [Nymphon striatum]